MAYVTADFIREETTSTGSTLTLTQIDGYARFSTIAEGSEVTYAIVNGNNCETGVGTIGAGNTLVRATTPDSTLVSGTYNDTNPTSITLVGTSVITLTLNSTRLDTIIDHVNNTTPVYDSVQLSGGTGDAGKMSWNTDEETIDLVQNGTTLQLGQETHVHCKNNSGAQINNGTVVMATGTLGASGRITIAPYTIATNVRYILGVTTEDIADGTDGKVTNFGKVRGLDTSSYSEGQILYADNNGAFTATEPTTAPYTAMAFVVNVHATVGTIMVRFTPFDELSFGSYDDVDALQQINVDRNEPTGFIREFPYTMGVIEFSPDGTDILQVKYNGSSQVFSENSAGLFYDGSSAAARTFAISPITSADGGDDTFTVYTESIKHVITSTKTAQASDTDGLLFFYFDTSGNLQTATSLNQDYFEDTPITSVIYWNKTTQEAVVFGDERHGITMTGAEHYYHHFADGCKYVSGMGINGITSGSAVYTSIDSGVAFDEDVIVKPVTQTDTPTWYMLWDGVAGKNVWQASTADLATSYQVSTVTQYNLNNAGEYSIEPINGNDAAIYFFFMTNNTKYPYIKVMGQGVYNSTNAARAAINDELATITLGGLPAPELIPIAAIIVRANGQVRTLSDGSSYLDLREVKVTGSGSISGTSQYHEDLLGRTVSDAHPASAITNTPSGDIAATTVQSAIDELDTEKEPADATILKDADIGSAVQAYDADIMKTDVAQVMTAQLTVDEVVETSYNLTGTDVDPVNGTMQYKTTTGATTLTGTNFAAGQSVTVTLSAPTSVAFTGFTWITSDGAAPTINNSEDTFVMWMDNDSNKFVAYVGGKA